MANAMASSDRLRQFFDPRVVERGDLVAVSGSVTIVGGGVDRTVAVVRGRLAYDTALTLTQHESRPALVASCTCAHGARADRLAPRLARAALGGAAAPARGAGGERPM